MMIDINQSYPVLCPDTNKTNYHLNILTNLWANSLLCRPTLIGYVQIRIQHLWRRVVHLLLL